MPKVINAKKSGFINYAESGDAIFPQKPIIRLEKLKPGVYGIGVTQDGQFYFMSISTMSDDLVDLPNFTSQLVINEINKFWEPATKKRYDRYGIVYKRGILLHGKQGTGKSCIITKVMEHHVNDGGLVIFCPSPALLKQAAHIIKEIQGDVKLLVIYEELDSLLERDEGGFLSLLDGEDQIDHAVFIATTNYLDRIPARIKNRPSRFASIIQVGVPDAETRRAFLEAKIPAEDRDSMVDIDLWVKATEGMTIDQLKDLIVSVLCIQISLEEAVKKLLSMEGNKSDSTEDLANALYDGGDSAANSLMGMLMGIGTKKKRGRY